MEKTNFDQLLERYLTGEVSEQEKIKLEAWLEVRKTNASVNLELSKEEEERLFQKIISSRDNVKDITTFKTTETKKGGWYLRIAASVLLLIGLTYAGYQLIGINQNGMLASRDEIQKLILNDGSIVWLRGESSLEYHEKPDGIRYAELQGEGLFEVAKDPDHPFIIQSSTVTLKVLGTSFDVKIDKERLELKVLTGKVNLSLNPEETGIDVQPNEKVIYKGSGSLEKQQMSREEKESILAHTEYNMQFNNATLAEVVKRLEDKFEITIKLDTQQIGECHITADLTDNGLERSLQLIKEVLNIEFTRQGNTITITGTGCN